ncbi:hypothetical protein CIW83_03790 [Tissierella sp. P1]|uniref:MSCRAMM family protein n=1 Tax=Tissierella sp. P1 TaxID=1280483 RepID=UPI000B9FBC50|nr:SpaA isopeptide-forming pilin-related protein [Tissierella sp. P1]OZV13338.1 hypothetical protein CIW83_03790 [Tissierella sp. P1]
MKKYSKLFIVFLLVLSLAVSIIPNISFADSGTDYPGNDSGFDFKIDPPESTIIYFDKDGNKIHDTNSIYWIEFTLSDDGKYLSFEANNVSIDALAVKGGNGYRLYENLGSSRSGFRSPDNNGGNIPEISHYSFNIIIDIPEEPWIGKVRVIKTVTDPNNIQSPEGISFTLIGPNGYEKTKETDDEGIIEFTELEEGQYTLTEDIPDGYLSSIGNGKTIILPDDADEDYIAEIEVENRKIPDESDPKGKITIKKLVIDPEDNIIEDGTEFEFEIYILNESEAWTLLDTVTIVGNSSVTVDGLNPGEYMIKEIDIPNGYTLTSDNNLEVSILEDVEANVDFTNQKDNETPPKWKGTIEVIKNVVDTRNATPGLSGFAFRLYKTNESIEEFISEQTTGSTGIVFFSDLGEGFYKLYELDRAGYIKGMSNSGLSLVLNRETTNEDRLLKVNITNIADYPDEENPETPEEDDDDDDNPPPDEDDDTPPPDEEETIEEEIPEAIPETPEEEVIIEEEIPEAAPEIKIESEEILPEEEIEIVESVPLAAPSLPATGTTSEYIFYGFGGLLLAIGQFIRRKK